MLSLQKSVELLQPLFDKFVEKTLQFRQKSCKELIPVGELNSVMSLCHLFDALATPSNGVSSLTYTYALQNALLCVCM